MVYIESFCIIQGERFSPNEFNSKAPVFLENGNEPGDLGSSGRYRAKAIPFGSGRLNTPAELESGVNAPVNWIAEALEQTSNLLQDLGADKITVFVNVAYNEQCSLEFDPALMHKLAAVGAHVAINCYLSHGAKTVIPSFQG